MQIEALLFDYDGTLANYPEAEATAVQNYCDRFGLPVEELDAPELGTVGWDTPWINLANSTGAEYYEMVTGIGIEALASTTVRKGVQEILFDAKALGLKTGVASLGYPHRVYAVLKREALLGEFDQIVLIDQIPRQAQNPHAKQAVVELCLHRLEVNPKRVLGFEDSPTGVRGFLEAGVPAENMFVFSDTREGFPESSRLKFISSFHEMMNLDRLISEM